MQLLKSNLIIFSLCFFIAGCQSAPVFNLKKIQTNVDDLHVILVKTDRVQQKCLFFNAEAENNWRHQYLMYILSEKNETLEIMQPTNQDKTTCESQMSAIEKILQAEPQVKLCVRGKLKKNPQDFEVQNEPVHFDRWGDHRVTYESLTLDSICNSKKCVSNNSVWINTCPGFRHAIVPGSESGSQ